MIGGANDRANSYIGQEAKNAPGGGYCCKWTAYVLLGDENNNQKGAKGWAVYGVKATAADAQFIVTSSHVAPIVNGYVINCSGSGSSSKIKAYSIDDAQKYIFNGAGVLRKLR